MINKFNEGDLVWLPSDITLTQMSSDKEKKEKVVSRWVRTKQPENVVILTGPVGAYYTVLYRGEKWLAREMDLFLQKKGK